MSEIIIVHLIISSVISVLASLDTSSGSVSSYLVGSWLAFTNVTVLFWFVRRIMAKKQVAIATAVIVFKYLILGAIIYFAVTRIRIHGIWFGAGLMTVLLTLGVTSKKLQPLLTSGHGET